MDIVLSALSQLLGGKIHGTGANPGGPGNHGQSSYRKEQVQKANSLRPDFPGEIDLKRGADQPQQKIHSGEKQGAVKNP